ncbi:PAS domain-containing protein [Pseudonocardia ammonioxydans]|uniref:PAS domain-containing protein n=1 Tax=Pseudonocardia ammonioxydans TaxID=260086 RepID=UPI001FEBEC10|nr:PAS domain S-box protein [Pseudonocardia ammonioxydans]
MDPTLTSANLIARSILSGPDAIVAADRSGTITYWNPGAQRIFGFSAEEATGRSLDLIIPERLRDAHWAGWQKVMDTGRSHYHDDDLLAVPALHRDGSTISVEFSISPLLDDDGGGLVGIAATLRDVTTKFQETRALRREVRELRRRLEEPAPDSPTTATSP